DRANGSDAGVRQRLDDFHGWAFAQVVDVRLVGKAKAGDDGVLEPVRLCLDLFDHVFRLGGVHFARGARELRQLRRGVDDEPGVDGDAVAAHARPRVQDVHSWMMVGKFDQRPCIDVELVADHGKLVRIGDVDVAVGVLGELGELRGARVGFQYLAGDEAVVETGGGFRGGFVHAADDTVVFDEFAQDVSGQHAFRAMRDEYGVFRIGNAADSCGQ